MFDYIVRSQFLLTGINCISTSPFSRLYCLYFIAASVKIRKWYCYSPDKLLGCYMRNDKFVIGSYSRPRKG